MTKTFDLLAYKKLLQMRDNGEISFLDNRLLTYQATVEQQITYNRKTNYFLLIDEYLTQIITPDKFRSSFISMIKKDAKEAATILKNFQELENFYLVEHINTFSDSIGEISTLCFDYDAVFDETIEPMSETEFYDLVNNCYCQLAEFNIQKISNNNQKYEHLISHSFKFLMFTIAIIIGTISIIVV